MGKLAFLAMSLFLVMGSAALVAYSLAYTGQFYLGMPGAALREQALTSAALIFGLVTIQFLIMEE
jgi:hypothetical protein